MVVVAVVVAIAIAVADATRSPAPTGVFRQMTSCTLQLRLLLSMATAQSPVVQWSLRQVPSRGASARESPGNRVAARGCLVVRLVGFLVMCPFRLLSPF